MTNLPLGMQILISKYQFDTISKLSCLPPWNRKWGENERQAWRTFSDRSGWSSPEYQSRASSPSSKLLYATIPNPILLNSALTFNYVDMARQRQEEEIRKRLQVKRVGELISGQYRRVAAAEATVTTNGRTANWRRNWSLRILNWLAGDFRSWNWSLVVKM